MKPEPLKALLLLVLIVGLLRGDDQLPEPPPVPQAQASSPIDELLGRHKDLVENLVAALSDSEAEVRETTMYTLRRIGKRAVPALIEKLRDKDRDLRANAAYVLAQLGKDSQEAMPSLLIALKDGDREVRRRAAYAIHRVVIEVAPVEREKAKGKDWRDSWERLEAVQHQVVQRLGQQAVDPGLLLPVEPKVPEDLPPIRSSNKPVSRP